MFYCAGRHPLAGVACSFAGLSGGFTASYTPSVIDPVMQSFTQAAAQTLDASYSVNVLCNYFFALGGTFFVIAACWYVTDKIVRASGLRCRSTRASRTIPTSGLRP